MAGWAKHATSTYGCVFGVLFCLFGGCAFLGGFSDSRAGIAALFLLGCAIVLALRRLCQLLGEIVDRLPAPAAEPVQTPAHEPRNCDLEAARNGAARPVEPELPPSGMKVRGAAP